MWPLHRIVFYIVFQVSLILYFVDYKHLKFNNLYIYPDWAYALGWTMALTFLVVLILTMIGQMCQTSGTFMQVSVEVL